MQPAADDRAGTEEHRTTRAGTNIHHILVLDSVASAGMIGEQGVCGSPCCYLATIWQMLYMPACIMWYTTAKHYN